MSCWLVEIGNQSINLPALGWSTNHPKPNKLKTSRTGLTTGRL